MRTTAFRPLAILRQSGRVSGAVVLGFGLTVAVNVVTARVLGPDGVGIVALVGVWTFYLQLVRPGFLSAAGREMPHLLGRGELAQTNRIQNVAVTGEALFVIVPTVVLSAAGFLYTSPVVRLGFWVAAAATFATTIQTSFTSLFYVYQRFDLVASTRLIASVVTPLLILVMLAPLGVYAPIGVPGVTALVALAFVWLHRDVLDFQWAVDASLMRELLKIGLPFTTLTIASWGYFMSDRAVLTAAGVPLAVLGYYSFPGMIIRGVAQVFWDYTAVLQPVFWHELGRAGAVRHVVPRLVSVWVPYTAAACAVTALAEAGFGAVVIWIAPRFVPSIAIFDVLIFILVFQNATQLPTLVLNARGVDRQWLNAIVWTVGLVINASVLWVVVRSGASLVTVAQASIAVDLAVAVAGFAIVHRFLFEEWRQAAVLYGWMCGLMLASVAIYVVFQTTPFSYGAMLGTWTVLARRTALAVAVWTIIAMAVWLWSAAWHRGELAAAPLPDTLGA